jgi:DNA replication licensing factor MCM5
MLKKMMGVLFSKCGPRLSESASEKLRNQYVVMRNGTSIYEREVGKKTAIPITVR